MIIIYIKSHIAYSLYGRAFQTVIILFNNQTVSTPFYKSISEVSARFDN